MKFSPDYQFFLHDFAQFMLFECMSHKIGARWLASELARPDFLIIFPCASVTKYKSDSLRSSSSSD